MVLLPIVRIQAALLLASALVLSPGVASADDTDEPTALSSVEAYKKAIAAQEMALRSMRGPSRDVALERLDKLRAAYDRDVHMYSPPTMVAGVVLAVLGTAGTVFGLVAEAEMKSSGSWDLRGFGLLYFAAPSFLGGVVPGVILIRVGATPVFRGPARAPKAAVLSLGVGGISGTF